MHREHGKSNEYVEVVDVPLFRRALRKGLLELKKGPSVTTTAGAKLLGIKRPYLSQLASGSYGAGGFRIARTLWVRLRKCLSDPWCDVIVQATLTSGERFFLDDHDGWVEDEISRIEGKSQSASSLMEDLQIRFGFRGEFDRFMSAAASAGWHKNDQRVTLSLMRTVEPLLRGEHWGVERSVLELNQRRQLGAFLTAGLRRELFLLKREGDVARSQRADMLEREAGKKRVNAEAKGVEAYDQQLDRDWLKHHSEPMTFPGSGVSRTPASTRPSRAKVPRRGGTRK